jgi:hypothetical protein
MNYRGSISFQRNGWKLVRACRICNTIRSATRRAPRERCQHCDDGFQAESFRTRAELKAWRSSPTNPGLAARAEASSTQDEHLVGQVGDSREGRARVVPRQSAVSDELLFTSCSAPGTGRDRAPAPTATSDARGRGFGPRKSGEGSGEGAPASGEKTRKAPAPQGRWPHFPLISCRRERFRT